MLKFVTHNQILVIPQDQVEWNCVQPGPVEGSPGHGRRVGTRCSLVLLMSINIRCLQVLKHLLLLNGLYQLLRLVILICILSWPVGDHVIENKPWDICCLASHPNTQILSSLERKKKKRKNKESKWRTDVCTFLTCHNQRWDLKVWQIHAGL